MALIALTVSLLLVMLQRTVPKRRRLAGIVVLPCLLLLRHNAFLKGDLHEETLTAFLLGLLLFGLFWLVIGRYNPVRDEEAVRVLRMDD